MDFNRFKNISKNQLEKFFKLLTLFLLKLQRNATKYALSFKRIKLNNKFM
jgi:hypothetical protein